MLLQSGADAFAACYMKDDATSALHLAVKRSYLRCVEVRQGLCMPTAILAFATNHTSIPHTADHLHAVPKVKHSDDPFTPGMAGHALQLGSQGS